MPQRKVSTPVPGSGADPHNDKHDPYQPGRIAGRGKRIHGVPIEAMSRFPACLSLSNRFQLRPPIACKNDHRQIRPRPCQRTLTGLRRLRRDGMFCRKTYPVRSSSLTIKNSTDCSRPCSPSRSDATGGCRCLSRRGRDRCTGGSCAISMIAPRAAPKATRPT
jgi:hypothetical protein